MYLKKKEENNIQISMKRIINLIIHNHNNNKKLKNQFNLKVLEELQLKIKDKNI